MGCYQNKHISKFYVLNRKRKELERILWNKHTSEGWIFAVYLMSQWSKLHSFFVPQTWNKKFKFSRHVHWGIVQVAENAPFTFHEKYNCIANTCLKAFNHVDATIILIHFTGRLVFGHRGRISHRKCHPIRFVRSCFEASSCTGAVRFYMKSHEVLKKKKLDQLKKLQPNCSYYQDLFSLCEHFHRTSPQWLWPVLTSCF